jgi:glycosyltransferase involved in cell wall biosynthesis
MKLLYLISEDWFFCSHFSERALAAKAAGYEVVVMTHIDKHRGVIGDHFIRVIPLELDRRSANPLRELGVVMQIWRAYRKEKPDIVHHVALKPVLYGSIAARLTGMRAVINAPVGMGYVFISQSLKARFLRFFVAFGLKALLNPRGSKVVFENHDDCETLIAEGYVRQKDAVLIRGAGIDTDLFHPSPEAPGLPIVLLTARMLWDKGVGEFVDAARRIRAQGLKARFLLVGAPDPFNRAAIDEGTLREWQREGVIEWLGFRSDIRHLVGESAIVCLPSYREGLPKSLLEALACGKPVVTTDVPGCREVVADGVNGRLVPARDAVALAGALTELLASPEKRAQMGQAGRKRAETEFAATRIVAETLALYQALKPITPKSSALRPDTPTSGAINS